MTDNWHAETNFALKRLRRQRAIREMKAAKATSVDNFPVGCIVKYAGQKSSFLVGQYGEVVSRHATVRAPSGKNWPTDERARARGGVLILWHGGHRGWSLVTSLRKVSD